MVVLSNNDGCCVARSEEAMALGIRMGQPFFEVRDLLEAPRGVALSSNYTLCAAMSRRLMATIGQYSREQEIYSIDKSFLRFAGCDHWDLTHQGRELRARVLKGIGLPVGVGIGATKNLAKLANLLAKKHPDCRAAVLVLLDLAAVGEGDRGSVRDAPARDRGAQARLLAVMDNINRRWGRGTVRYLADAPGADDAPLHPLLG